MNRIGDRGTERFHHPRGQPVALFQCLTGLVTVPFRGRLRRLFGHVGIAKRRDVRLLAQFGRLKAHEVRLTGGYVSRGGPFLDDIDGAIRREDPTAQLGRACAVLVVGRNRSSGLR